MGVWKIKKVIKRITHARTLRLLFICLLSFTPCHLRQRKNTNEKHINISLECAKFVSIICSILTRLASIWMILYITYEIEYKNRKNIKVIGWIFRFHPIWWFRFGCFCLSLRLTFSLIRHRKLQLYWMLAKCCFIWIESVCQTQIEA